MVNIPVCLLYTYFYTVENTCVYAHIILFVYIIT